MGSIKRKIIWTFISLIFILALACGLTYGFYLLRDKLSKQKYESLTVLAAQEIKQCAEMVSIKSVYTDIITVKKTGALGMSKSYSLIKYSGTIRAGIEDITAATFDISEDRTAIKLSIPPSVVLSNDITNQQIFDESNNVFSLITTQEVFSEIDLARKKQELELVRTGFLDEADDYNKQLLTRIFSAMGFKYIDIEIQKRDASSQYSQLLNRLTDGTKQESKPEDPSQKQEGRALPEKISGSVTLPPALN